MTNLPFTSQELEDSIKNGFITRRWNQENNLQILNYSSLAQYERHWTEVTKSCRGLITDKDLNIVARPFQKIFNYTEIIPDPVIFDRQPYVQDKLDGSLGIIYKSSQGWQVATRGSFESEQAEWATRWLKEQYRNYDQPEGYTTLVEIIYPDNRICVDYGNRAELVLLTAIENSTGADISPAHIDWWNKNKAEQHTGLVDIDEAYRFATSDVYEANEGVVCTWYKYNQPSFRLKIKHPEYVRLHGIIHNFSKKKVWESLSKGENFLDLLENVPDEFYNTVKEVMRELTAKFYVIKNYAEADYAQIKHLTKRKDFAEEAKKSKYSALLFKMWDSKDYSDLIWKMIEPKGE